MGSLFISMPKVEAENEETDEKSETRANSKSLLWKISSQFQLIGIITLIITLAVTLETSVSYNLGICSKC